MKFLIIAFLSFYTSISLADTNTYTRIDAKSGQIQIVVGDRVVKSAQLSPDKVKFENNFDLIEYPKNLPADFDKEKLKKANLYNMESVWISGERFVTVDGQKYPVNLTQTIEVMKYMTYQDVLKASKSNKKIDLKKYSDSLSKQEKQNIAAFENKIQTAIQNLTVEDLCKEKDSETNCKKNRSKVENDYSAMQKNVEKLAQSGSTIIIGVIDSNPYVLGDSASQSFSYSSLDIPQTPPLSPKKKTTIRLKSANGNLLCTHMSQSQPQPIYDQAVLKLDFNFAIANYMSIVTTSAQQQLVIAVDTVDHNTFCSPNADTIQQSGFESGDR